MHGLTDREREWLEYAALLHDIGALISYARHHRHSYYLIKNGDLRGFIPTRSRSSRWSRATTGAARPSDRTRSMPRLPSSLRRTVRTLASILRVAESLDRSHAQSITGLELRDQR